MTTRRLAFINEKGGSCKTTCAVSTAAYIAEQLGQRVLLVDVDPQGQAGKSLGIDVRRARVTLRDLLMDSRVAAGEAVLATRIDNLDVIVANKQLADWPLEVAHRERRELLLRERLRPLWPSYDLVIFDAPPSLGLFSLSVMLAAEEIVVPVSLTYFGLDGCAEIVDTVAQLRERYQHRRLEVRLVVATLYRQTRLADEILAKLGDHFGATLARSVVGYNVKIDEAQSHGQTIWEYAPRSKGARALRALATEIFELGGRG